MEFLYEELDTAREYLNIEIPSFITEGLSNNIELREYQVEAIKNFIINYEKKHETKQIHNLFHMATGSGKTVIMASLILYLYTKGYRKFIFFVNQTNILEKTKDNFTNNLSNKFLFSNEIKYVGDYVNIKMVDNFSSNNISNYIEIIFTTTQKLHQDLFFTKENTITYEDFENNEVVFISDESHHINTNTKKKTTQEEEDIRNWEVSIMNAYSRNKNNILLEFTATADLKDKNVLDKYKDKIVYDYPLIKFRKSGYTKDFKNFATDTDLWTRTLIAMVMSEYRKFLFSDLKLNIKPVLMLKSQKIKESEKFYDEFFSKLGNLTTEELLRLYQTESVDIVNALNYFKEKDGTLELLEHSLKDSFIKENSIIMNGASEFNKENQLKLNSLEDLTNNIRFIFAVDMLNEGWDVLNLFDIVRLYDTRQGSGKPGKVGSYTIKEAQLIGRGARYCSFKVDEDQIKYKRKYDNDLDNPYRILETMYFHSKNDSSYISELKRALIETGLQDEKVTEIEYKVKDSFKETEFYKSAYVFSNKRVERPRNYINKIEDSLKNKRYRYTAMSNKANIISLLDDESISMSKFKILVHLFKEIDYNILIGAAECFNELKFNLIKEKYPNVKSMKQFLTSDEYLGNSEIEISYINGVSGKDIYQALKKAMAEISKHIISIKPEYIGTKEFEPKFIHKVLKNKKISLSSIVIGGHGDSQNKTLDDKVRLDLTELDWYVYNDNYGTSEEKKFIKYFYEYIEPKLKEKELEYYVVRNERISDLAIYSFNNGERFEPDFLMFVRKKSLNDSYTKNIQLYAEPKGDNLLKEDEWKEKFLKEIEYNYEINNIHDNQFKIIGLPFYNVANRKEEFKNTIDRFIEEI